VKVEIISNSSILPEYQTIDSAGLDLSSIEEVIINPMERKLIDTGLKIAIPSGYEGQIRPRSGLAWKEGITVLNAPGTIDSDYRGNIKVMLINLDSISHTIAKGERIAQLVISKYEKVTLEMVEVLSNTERGEGGFGSTGK
jgi:dUTP pyrophosphatase